MGRHDRFFKELFQARFADLLHIVAPSLTSALRLDQVDFVRDEFVDVARGERRQVDLLARAPTVAGAVDGVLLHCEIAAEARKKMLPRLWRYYKLISLRYDQPVIPILINLTGGPAGVTTQQYSLEFGDLEMVRFRYLCFGVAGGGADRFLARTEPLSWALAALMKSPTRRPAEQLLDCRVKLAKAPVSEAHRHLLVNCVTTYLRLDDRDREEYERMTADERIRRILAEDLTWEDELRREGHREGLLQGHEEGLLNGERKLLLLQLESRFGQLPEPVRRTVAAITSGAELSRLGELVLTAGSLAEMGLEPPPGGPAPGRG